MKKCRFKLIITGTVQGVGFRPTVYRYAKELDLTGFVGNDSRGVFIELQGNSLNVESFITRLKSYPPPLSKIDSFESFKIDQKEENEFSIVKSKSFGDKNVEISKDISTCNDCLKEISDPTNRRYLYPFTNCTNCGPRFTIIKDRPYDRSLTSMKIFSMCHTCQSEYDDPMDRRFHAQPNCCKECGPKLEYKNLNQTTFLRPIERLTKDILNKQIVAIKGLGGFNIACSPYFKQIISKLRELKRRPTKSFALMAKNLSLAKKIAAIDQFEEQELTSSSSPIVLLKKKNETFNDLSPDNNYLGIMLPYTPMHHILFKNFDYLLMTSANLRDEPIAIDDPAIDELLKKGVIDSYLTHNRDIIHRADDSIVQVINRKRQVLRRSRGIVPTPINIKARNSETSISLGANMKNTFALRKNDKVYISQHIGELIDYSNFLYQAKEIKDLTDLFEITPAITKNDAHPGYENYSKQNTPIYHHHAHMLSAMGEHNLLGLNTLGVIADGTGYGTDSTIWGFEFLEVKKNYSSFKRVAHLKEFYLPGGEISLKEIERISISLLKKANIEIPDNFSINSKNISMLLDKKINSQKTSSLGRLFDGISGLIGILNYSDYEARAAIILQKLAESFQEETDCKYTVTLTEKNPIIIDYKVLLKEITDDLREGVSKAEMSKKFHHWVVNSIISVIKELCPERVVFSGGCFQNRLLTTLLTEELNREEISYFFNESIPINDAGISFGQSLL